MELYLEFIFIIRSNFGKTFGTFISNKKQFNSKKMFYFILDGDQIKFSVLKDARFLRVKTNKNQFI